MRISNVKVNVWLWKVTKVRIRIRWIVQTLRNLLSLENFVRYKSEGKTMNMKIISSLSTVYNCKIKRNTWNISARRSRCSVNKNDIFGLSVVVSVEISRDQKFNVRENKSVRTCLAPYSNQWIFKLREDFFVQLHVN